MSDDAEHAPARGDDTVRGVALGPRVEDQHAFEALGLRERKNVDLIACPSCGRAEVDVIEVHVSAGDEVELESSLVTLETDKAAMDVPAVVAGTIESVLIKVGEKISAGASLAIIDAVANQEPDTAPAAAPAAAAKPQPPASSAAPEKPAPSAAAGPPAVQT